jgi:hypothetical protein
MSLTNHGEWKMLLFLLKILFQNIHEKSNQKWRMKFSKIIIQIHIFILMDIGFTISFCLHFTALNEYNYIINAFRSPEVGRMGGGMPVSGQRFIEGHLPSTSLTALMWKITGSFCPLAILVALRPSIDCNYLYLASS